MASVEKASRPGGRTEANRLAVHRAVLKELQSQGLSFTYADVAARSGVSRRTIHRRWPDRNELLVDVLREEYSSFAFVPSGDLAVDLREFAIQFRDFSMKPTTILVDGLAALSPDPEFSALSARAFVEATHSLRESLSSARKARGLSGDADVQLVLMMLTSTIAASCSIMRAPLDDETVERLAHVAHLAALADLGER